MWFVNFATSVVLFFKFPVKMGNVGEGGGGGTEISFTHQCLIKLEQTSCMSLCMITTAMHYNEEI